MGGGSGCFSLLGRGAFPFLLDVELGLFLFDGFSGLRHMSEASGTVRSVNVSLSFLFDLFLVFCV